MALWALAIFVTYEVADLPTLCIGTGFAIPQIYGCGASCAMETLFSRLCRITLCVALNYRSVDAAAQGGSSGVPSLPISSIRLDRVRGTDQGSEIQVEHKMETASFGIKSYGDV
jgi:hypothetical protein